MRNTTRKIRTSRKPIIRSYRKPIIRKEITVPAVSSWTGNEGTSLNGLTIDYVNKSISFRNLKGPLCDDWSFFMVLLADKDIRYLIHEYQQDTCETRPYRLWNHCGMSGCQTVLETTATDVDGFMITKTREILYISMAGKVDMIQDMKISDIVKLVDFLGYAADVAGKSAKQIRRMAGLKYVKTRLTEDELPNYRTEVAKII